MKNVLFIFLMNLISLTLLQGQILINEFSASNLKSFYDNYDKTEDWIELYNSGDTDFDLSGWHISDKTDKPTKWMIPNGTIIPAKDYLVFWCSGRDQHIGGHFHTNFKLTQTKGSDRVILSNPNGDIVQDFDLGLTLEGHSWCRKTDGASDWRICTNPGPGQSNNGRKQYTSYTATPSMDIKAGFYDTTIIVNLFNNELNSTLRYTLNGHNPTPNSPIFSEAIEITETTMIKAQSFSNDPDILPGKMDFNTYFIDEDFSVAVFSVGADKVKDLANGNGGLEPVGSLEYFNVNKEREAIAFGSLNRHGQDSWVLPHRSLDWVSRDEMGYTKAVLAPLFSYSDRDEYQRFMFRNSGDDNYPAINDNSHKGSTHIRDEYVQHLAHEGGLHLDTRAVERVVVFLNGEYWGLYGLRERPVDHDYTEEYYDQDKYHLHYLTTWGTTEAEYGGYSAFSDWYDLRDFVLENDMSLEENYQVVKDKMDVISFMDYFIVNLNVVAKDWLNYNTAWWRGLDEDGGHKKWGYVLWDLDATFDYYINYTGIPNDNPDAKPCDIEDIADSMDNFFGEGGGGGDEIENPEDCQTILNGSSPYPADDPIFVQVINLDNYCCYQNWDNICQDQYDEIEADSLTQDTCFTILNGTCPHEMDDWIFIQTIQEKPSCCSDVWDPECDALYTWFFNQAGTGSVSGNVGKHEKMLIKLQEENKEFRELYYARNADLMNTVYTCENMLETLDEMVAVIEPEMPRQIDRWGGTLTQWEYNVDILRNYVQQRCELLDDGMLECFDLTGPFDLTLSTMPEGIADVQLNTLELIDLPWTGGYFGNMDNNVNTSIFTAYEDEYTFSHWESKNGTTVISDIMSENTKLMLNAPDTLVAVYKLITSTEEIANQFLWNVYPNPVNEELQISYRQPANSQMTMNLFSVWGDKVLEIVKNDQANTPGDHKLSINLKSQSLVPGVYILELAIGDRRDTKRIVLLD